MLETLTGISVLLTAIYAYVTFRILQANRAVVTEMQTQSDSLLRPYISIAPFISTDTIAIYLKIENTGKTSARNLTLEIDKDFYTWGSKSEDHNLRFMRAFKEPIECFAPGQSLIFGLGTGPGIFGKRDGSSATDAVFVVTATYIYGQGKAITERNPVDLNMYLGSQGHPDALISRLGDIKEAIEKLNKNN